MMAAIDLDDTRAAAAAVGEPVLRLARVERRYAEGDHFLEVLRGADLEIRAGEIFQIQIGNRLSVKTEARPFDIFRHLRMINPSPYMFYYRQGDHHILGASPEMMVTVQAGRMTHRPIEIGRAHV